MGQRVGDDYKKGVESTSYLRLVESRKFIIYRTVRQWPMSMGLYILGSDALSVSNQTDYFIIPFPVSAFRSRYHHSDPGAAGRSKCVIRSAVRAFDRLTLDTGDGL